MSSDAATPERAGLLEPSLHPADGGRMQPGFRAFPPVERWSDWVERGRPHSLVATTCFNCEAACGLLAYVDQETRVVTKFEGNPHHPGSRGRNCAKGPATLNQIHDPERILYPLRRTGARGAGQWERVSWDDALDDLAGRIRDAIRRKEPNKVMYHVGRPGEDGYTERVLAAWGVDGHNSHTNICSAGARAGYAFWMGMDRPSPDHANARCILLISSHLEAGHYFNPHAQRILEAKQRGATIIVMDPRLSNTASHAHHWLPTYPGSEPVVLLAMASWIIRRKAYDRDFLRQWVNWEEFLDARRTTHDARAFEDFERELETLYADYTPERAEAESGVPAATITACAHAIAQAGSAFSAHTWRASAAGNLGGWMTARCLFFLNVLTGSVGTEGGTIPASWTKFVPAPHVRPPHPASWNELTWPKEYPLAFFEMSFLLPHFLKEGRGSLDVYFTRVYNPVWTNPDGFTWIEVLRDEALIGRHAALTPVWSETAWFADYVLPVGLGSERHDLASFETHGGSWLGFRQPVQRALKDRLGERVTDTRDTNPGEVWEENEFWIELSWRIDPDGSMGIRRFFESPFRPGEKLRIDEYYRWIFENSVPGLPEKAQAEGLTPMEYMRRYASFEVPSPALRRHEQPVPPDEMAESAVGRNGRVYTAKAPPPSPNIVPMPVPPPDAQGRRAAGVMVDGVARRGFPTPSGKLEFYSSTLAAWGWPELAIPTAIESHVDPRAMDPARGEFALVPTFRLPMLIHTRSGNAKWLNEIAHSNPLWIATTDAARLGVEVGDLVRVLTEIGYFVVKAWVTEGMRPGVVACSHHLGRWRVADDQGTDRWSSALVRLEEQGNGQWRMRRLHGVAPWQSADGDSSRVWWQSAGVHQNLTFPVHPDPVSGAHAWHQKVRVVRAEPDDREGDIVVDTAKSHAVYQEWLAMARPAPGPGGMRRPHWLLRPLRPTAEAYKLPAGG